MRKYTVHIINLLDSRQSLKEYEREVCLASEVNATLAAKDARIAALEKALRMEQGMRVTESTVDSVLHPDAARLDKLQKENTGLRATCAVLREDCEISAKRAEAAEAAQIRAAEARERELRQWQAIETAPKDGTPVLVSNPERGGPWIAYWQDVYSSGFRSENPWQSLMLNMRWHKTPWASCQPTHWQPIPDPVRTVMNAHQEPKP